MRTLLATALLLATSGAASAYCVSVPDDQSSAYVRNGVNRTICLSDDLAASTAQKNFEVQVDSALGKLDRNFVSDKLDAIRPVVPAIPGGTPSWP